MLGKTNIEDLDEKSYYTDKRPSKTPKAVKMTLNPITTLGNKAAVQKSHRLMTQINKPARPKYNVASPSAVSVLTT